MATRTLLGLAAIVVAAVLLRVFLLGKESLWWDEAASVYIAGLNWSQFRDVLWNEEANMAFYYFILHFWVGLGRTEFVLRLLSALLAAASIPVFYMFSARMFQPRTGLLAALLLALNVYHIRYSQEARSYALLVLLVTLSSWSFVAGMERPSWKAWTVYVVTTTLAVYTHFFGGLVVAAHWVSTLFLRRRDVPWGGLVTSTCAIGALLVPLGLYVLLKEPFSLDWVVPAGPDVVARLLTYLAGAAPVWTTPAATRVFALTETGRRVLMLVYAGAVALAFAPGVREEAYRRPFERWKYAFLAAWLLVPPIVTFSVSLFKPIFIMYYLIVSLPPLVLLAAAGLSRIRKPALSIGVLGLFVILAGLQIFAYYSYATKEDWRSATAYILSGAEPGDGVLFYRESSTGSLAAFEYYRDRLHAGSSVPPSLLSWDHQQRGRYRRLWLVLGHDGDGRGRILQDSLTARRHVIEERDFPGPIRVLLYSPAGHP